MADNRYLEIIKRFLSAETYFRRRQAAQESERNQSRPGEGTK